MPFLNFIFLNSKTLKIPNFHFFNTILKIYFPKFPKLKIPKFHCKYYLQSLISKIPKSQNFKISL